MRMTKREKPKPKIAKVIDDLMTEHRIANINDLAAKTGMNQPTLQRIYAGVSKEPRAQSLRPLMNFFGVTREQLLGEEYYTKANPAEWASAEARALARKWDRLPKHSKRCIADLVDILAGKERPVTA